MKYKILLTLLIILNLALVFLCCVWVWLGFTLFIPAVGEERGWIVVAEKTSWFLTWFIPGSIGLILINTVLFKWIIEVKKPIRSGLLLGLAGTLMVAGSFLYSRQDYMEYQRKNTRLGHYLDSLDIDRAEIISGTDTMKVAQLVDFITEIGTAICQPGPYKYIKSRKVLLYLADGSTETIPTNGLLFGPYKERYFKAGEDVIEKYLSPNDDDH